jgi:hypothetical protein
MPEILTVCIPLITHELAGEAPKWVTNEEGNSPRRG